MVPSLIAGPRGRRLVLELAGRYDDDVRAAANDLALLYDLGRGAGTAVFGWAGGRPLTQGQIEEEVARRAPTLPDFARALGNVAFPKEGPTPGEFHEAMTATVADAMYWQPPQGADVLASAPELAAALGEVAARVAPHAPRWWSHPMHPDQHALAWYDSPLAPPLTPARWREATRAEERRARREYPAHLGAGVSGTWWSTPDGAVTTRALAGVPVGLDWAEDMSAGAQAAQVAPAEAAGARILEIPGPRAWTNLCRRHPLEVTHSRRHDWYRVTAVDGRWVIPDWAALAGTYDAVHLTPRAYLAGATRSLGVGDGLYSMIAGWGPGETRWLTPPPMGEARPWGRAKEGDWHPGAAPGRG